MNGWETIVLDLNTNKVKTYIPTPNGGDTHSGGFVRYNPDWTGELLADMGGPKRAVREIMQQRAVAAAAAAGGAVAVAAWRCSGRCGTRWRGGSRWSRRRAGARWSSSSGRGRYPPGTRADRF